MMQSHPITHFVNLAKFWTFGVWLIHHTSKSVLAQAEGMWEADGIKSF